MPASLPGAGRPGSLLRHGAPPLVIAHRGASADAPENTLAAFRAAWSQGVSWLETDVQPTADLVPVLFHDDTLERTTDGSGALRKTALHDLANLDAGSWFDAAFAAERIPTLHALLTALPLSAGVLLEIKGPHTAAELIAELAVVRATGTDRRVWMHSFKEEAIRELADALPGGWVGLLREDRLDDDPVAVCRQLGVASYHPDHRLLDKPDVVEDLHRAGVSVVVYTADEESDWARLDDLGVDGIITNRPAQLLAWQRR